MVELGYRFVTAASDVHLMAAGARAAVLEAAGQGTSSEVPSDGKAVGLY